MHRLEIPFAHNLSLVLNLVHSVLSLNFNELTLRVFVEDSLQPYSLLTTGCAAYIIPISMSHRSSTIVSLCSSSVHPFTMAKRF